MKTIFIIIISLVVISFEAKAQSPQFAVVRPNGATQVFPSWETAYSAAVDGDFMYLPGTGISASIIINKRLHIFGAGHHPDSTGATARTIFTNTISVYSGASNGSIHGILINDYLNLGNNNSKLENYLIKNCYITGAIALGASTPDSFPEYITISENIFASAQSSTSQGCKNLLFEKNIVFGQMNAFQYCSFRNNIFLHQGSPLFINTSNSVFENNIFNSSAPIIPSYNNCFNSFQNNIKLSHPSFYNENPDCPVLLETNNISVNTIDSIFISYISSGNFYDNNFHLSSDCPCINAGTDGSDLGIYGTIDPTSEGWLPSNPHIYFKDIDPSTGPDGKLHIQVGVRANNN